MVLDERARHNLYLRLEETLGADAATTLMEHLPPVGWAAVATKRDLDQLAALTKRDLDEHRAVTKRYLDEHRAVTKRDLEQLALTTRSDLEHMGECFRLELVAMESRVTGMLHREIHAAITSQTRILAFTLVGTMLTTSGLAFAAAAAGLGS